MTWDNKVYTQEQDQRTYENSAEARRVTLVNETGDNNDSDNPLAVREHSFISTDNSSADILNAGIAFTGEWEDIQQFSVVLVTVRSDVASATDGLRIEFNEDPTTYPSTAISDDVFTVPADSGKTYSFQPVAKYFRVVYTNGGTNQAVMRLHTQLKSDYVKPSSHRIQDSIIDEDDAELQKSVLTGQDDLSGNFDNVTTYRKVLNVNAAYVHRKIVNETYHQDTGTETTVAVAITAGDTSCTVADATGIIVGSQVKLSENGIQELGLMTITVVAGNVLTFDRPVTNDYTTSALVTEVTTNMAVSGSLASPQIFEIEPPTGVVWQFTRVLFAITDATAPDDGKFGGMTALTNGVALRATTEAGRTVVFGNWKNNGDMKLDMYDVSYTDKAPAGNHGVNGRWTFTKAEVVAEIDGSDPLQKMEILIQDDLTDLLTFTMRAQGRVFSP